MDRRLLILALGVFALGTDSFVVAGVLPETGNWHRNFKRPLTLIGRNTLTEKQSWRGLVGGSADNLRGAIEAVEQKAEMFRQFALEATEDGYIQIARLFETISRDEAERCIRFQAALAAMGVHGNPQIITGNSN